MACTQLLCTQPTLSLKPGLLPIQVYDAQVTSSLLNLPYELKLHIIDHVGHAYSHHHQERDLLISPPA